MAKIFLAFLLLILGVGSCLGGPLLFAVELLPETLAELTPGPSAVVDLTESSGYLLVVTRPRLAGAGALVPEELPEGTYGFQPVGGEPIHVDRGASAFRGSGLESTYLAVGGARLEPGSYRVLTPVLPAGWGLEVARTEAVGQSAKGLLGMGAGLVVALVLGALLLLAAAILLLLGILETARGGRPEPG